VSRALGEGARLLTLVGPGGMGKTRLAIRYGRGFPGGAWFCDLTEARGADGIASAVGGVLGVQLGRGDAIGQLAHAIAGRGACLLVLDNFEQVVAHAAETLGRWRALAPDATFLVTSRERLGLAGERTHEVAPLSADEALGLFTLRARGLRPGFALAGPGEAAARELVRLLDGIPLAIELAAARIRVMSVEQILDAMKKRFQLLAGGSGARHETLEGTIDESWELLAPWERAALSQCAVFEGGCTLEAAAGVLDLGAWPEAPPIVDVVGSLVDKSLLRSWAPPGLGAPEVRFGMYVSLQEYARKRLHSAPDAERAAEVRHGIFYARAEATGLERELDNLVSACRRAIARGDSPVVGASYRAAWQVLRAKGPLGTALALGSEALADPRLQDEARAIVEVGLGEANWYAGRYEDARTHCAAAVAIARQCGAARLEARAGAMLGRSAFVLDRIEEARAAFDAALALARRLGDVPSLSAALNGLGMMQHELGRTEEARLAYEEALAITRDGADPVQEAVTLLSLGILQHKRGRLDEAGDLFERALAIHRRSGNRRSEGVAHLNLGSLRSDQGRMAESRAHGEAALAIARAIGTRVSEGVALVVLGELHSEMEEVDEARAWLEPALTLHRELGDRRTEGIVVGDLARLHELRDEPDAARAGYEAALAIHREVGDRHYEGAALTSLAAVLLARGSHAEAREALALAEPILREIAADHELGRMLCVRAELEQARGDAAAARAALAEAEALVAASNGRPGNEIERALARARRVLAGSDVA
jgi:predicted ATPase